MKNKVLVIFLILLLSTTFVVGQPSNPTQVPDSTVTHIEIVYPKTQAAELDKSLMLYFDVLNSSFAKLSSTGTSCTIKIQDPDEDSLVSANLLYDSTEKVWYYNISAASIYELGYYPYYVYCSTTTTEPHEYGFISGQFSVTESGHPQEYELFEWGIVMGLGLYLFILLYIGLNWKFSIFRRGEPSSETNIIQVFFVLLIMWLGLPFIQLLIEIADTYIAKSHTITILQTFYQIDYFVNIVVTLYLAVFMLFNLLLYFGVDVLKSFRGGKR